jgi:zinc protease
MKYELRTLANGLQVLFVDLPGSKVATTQIWFRSGAALEDKNSFGVAHFLEHMLFKGTPSRPNGAIAREVESFGGEMNAFTSFDYTSYYINTPNIHLVRSIDILLDMCLNPRFLDVELFPERDVVFEEYRRGLDNPFLYSFHRLQKSCFSGGYVHPIIGTGNTIKRFSRDMLETYMKRYYNNANCMLVVGGDLTKKDEIITKIESFSFPKGNPSIFPAFTLKSKPTVEIHAKAVRMAQLTVAISAPDYASIHAAAEDLAINCLGHGQTSPLYEKLVTQSTLANGVGASTMFFSKGGAHFIRFQCPPNHLDQAYTTFLNVIRESITTGFSEADLQKIKNQYLASKIFDKETVESFCHVLGQGFAQNGDIHSEEKFIDRLRKGGTSDITHSLINIFSRPMHVSLQIPIDENISRRKKSLIHFASKLNNLAKIGPKKKLVPTKKKSSQVDPSIQVVELKQGIHLLYRHNPMTPSFVMHSYLRGGLVAESKKVNGLHHLLAATLTKGYADTTYNKLKTWLETHSASLSGFSGKNAYGLISHGLTEDAECLLGHFFGTLLAPAFPEKFINHERKLTLRTLESDHEDPVKICFDMAVKIAFPNHPYSMNPLGESSSLKHIKRSALKTAHSRNLRSSDILFTFCGDLPLERVLDLLNKPLEKLPARRPPSYGKISYPFQYNVTQFQAMHREQTQILLFVPVKGMGNSEEPAINMLTSWLDGQSSDLFVKVRDEMGLCYAVRPLHLSGHDGGYWGIYIASGHDKVEAAIKAIKHILAKLAADGLSEENFARLKENIAGKALLDLQTNDDYANTLSVPLFFGLGPDHHHEFLEKINTMKREDFNSFLSRFLTKSFNQVIVGRETT